MKFVASRVSALLLFVCMVFVVVPGFGQQTQASLTGQVADPSGAAIPNATVIITNVDTAISRTVPTSTAGRYIVTNLNPGHYSVTVKADGFSEKVSKGIVLAVGQDGALDVALSPGGASDVVTVNAEASVTETVSSAQGSVIDNAEVVGLPLNQRTFYSLAELSPAVYLPGQSSTLGFRGGFNVAGNNETANTFTVNGIDDNDQNVMAPSFRPSVEGIQEFQVLTGVYSAEYGRTSGGQVVVITKTGTNAVHGDVFEFIRNSQFDAKNYFTVPGTATTFRRNQFGGTVGGPIKKDKAFYFLSYEGLRLAQPTVGTTSVPNPAMLTGNFSSVAKQLYKPSTTPGGAATPYLNNQIPLTDFDPIGLALMKTYPCPNGTPGGGFQGGGCAGFNSTLAAVPYTLDEERLENLDEGSARVDWKIGEKDSLLMQYNYFNDPSFEPSLSLCSSALIPLYGCTQNQISTLGGVNYTHIFNPHWLNEFRFGLDRLEQPRIGQDISNTAFPKVAGAFSDPTIAAAELGGAPATSVTGYATIHPYTNLPQHRWDDHFNLVDNASWSHGNHSVKFGVNIVQARYSDFYIADSTGAFTFTGVTNSLGNQTTGSSIADLALGYAATATRSPAAPSIHVRYNSYGIFGQDDWKVSKNLTLNLGVRYEYFSPVYDTRNIMSNYLAPAAGTGATTGGSFLVAGQGGVKSAVYNGDGNNISPRIGFSLLPFGNEKTVIHGSYGVFYNAPSIGNGAILSLGLNVPFRLNQSFSSTTTATTIAQAKLTAAPSTNANVNITPFPSAPGATPLGTLAAPYQSVSPTGIDPNFRTMYLNEWGMDVQRQLTSTIALTVGYLGSSGQKIPRPIQINQALPVSLGGTGARPITGIVGPITNPLPAENGAPAQEYIKLANPTIYISEGNSSFNALTVKGQKTVGRGFSFLLSYTWAKSLDNTPGYASTSAASSGTPQNSFNLGAERGLSDFNVKQRVALSPVYELPFGRNKAFLTNGIGAMVAGGWQLSGIYQYDTGRPFTIGINTNNSGSVYGSDRPNEVANPNAGPKTVAQWFNTAAFVPNAVGTFGNEQRNAVIGPSYSEMDVAIQRTFAMTERLSFSFRFESFDVLNHPNYYNPLGTSTGEVGGSFYGQLTQANDPRSCQFSGKINF